MRVRNRIDDLHERFSLARAASTDAVRRGGDAGSFTSSVLIGIAVMALSWAAVVWLKTGNVTLALSGVVGANLAACALLMRGR